MTQVPLYDAHPAGEARAAVIVVQEAFGVTDHIQDVTRRFAAEGYRAVAPHFFHRTQGPDDEPLGYDNLEAIWPHMRALTRDDLLADLDSALAVLAAEGFPAGKVGVVGFCMGGTVTFLAAASRPVGAAVTFYGGGVGEGRFGIPSLVDLAPELQAPWLGLYGDLDQGISVAEVERLRASAVTASVQTEVVRYADADHGFHCDARPKAYNELAAKDAWKRTLDWFAEHLLTHRLTARQGL